ncbi:MAG: GNAT family N-acetyltransferase [Hyphomicrobiales bacterium]|nr:GNAT family N-acetyltransferase [Alphaproteobacteria bacterium]
MFYEPAFALAAAPEFGADTRAVLVRTAAGRLVGLFPGHPGRLKVAGWVHHYGPLGTPLVDRDEPEAVIGAWLDHLCHDPAIPPLLLLPLIPEHGAFAASLDAVVARGGHRNVAFGRHERALLTPGMQRPNYLERSMSAAKRKSLRRQRRRLQDIAPVIFETATTATGATDALSEFLALEASGWKGRAGTAIAGQPAIKAFVQNAVIGLAAEGKARIDRLVLNGAAIAATLTLSSGDTAWCWKIAYNEELARSSPGVQLICDLTESLLAAPEPLRVDSCATAGHPMIDHIWRERMTMSDRLIELRPSAAQFALACGIESARRAAFAAAKSLRGRIRGR